MTRLRIIGGLVIILIIAAGIGYYVKMMTSEQPNRYRSAVTLTNGRIYIGYLSQRNNQYVVLDEAYYITSTPGVDPEPKQKLTLTKVSDEAYGPENRIYLNRNTIVSIAPMRNDSKVTGVITKYEQEKQKPTPSPSPAQESP